MWRSNAIYKEALQIERTGLQENICADKTLSFIDLNQRYKTTDVLAEQILAFVRRGITKSPLQRTLWQNETLVSVKRGITGCY